MSQDERALATTRIVLVEPEGAANVGSVARVMKNMGLHELVLVNPQCDPWGEQAIRMAVHADDRLLAAVQVDSLAQALTGCERAIATTARHQRHLQINAQSPQAILPWLLIEAPTALIFGPESRGLSNQDLNVAQHHLYIPTSPIYPALNLAQAVAVCCYELRQAACGVPNGPDRGRQPAALNPSIQERPQASLEQLEAYCQQLEDLLLDVGFLYPHTATARMLKLRRLLQRAQPSGAEITMLRGILRQINWRINQQSH